MHQHRLWLLLLLLSMSIPAVPQDGEGPALEAGTPAEPLKRRNPRYPSTALSRGSEGWALLSYVILPSGTVSNVAVEEVVGSKAFADAAVRAVESWTFKPATWQGQPVEQCSNRTYIKFELEPAMKGARPDKYNKYGRIKSLIEANDLESAWEQLAEALDGDLNLYELAYFHAQGAELARLKGNVDDELAFMSHAAAGDRILGRQTNRAFLQRLFILQVQAGKVVDALDTFEDLRKYGSHIENWKEYEDLHARLVALRDGNQTVVAEGRIPDREGDEWSFWARRLLKRSVEFGDPQGTLSRLEFRCERKFVSDEFSANRNWTLPVSWGECDVYVFGKAGATFKLYELAPAVAASPPPT